MSTFHTIGKNIDMKASGKAKVGLSEKANPLTQQSMLQDIQPKEYSHTCTKTSE